MESTEVSTMVGAGLLKYNLLTIAVLAAITSIAATHSAHAGTVVVNRSTFNADTTDQTTSYFDSYGVTGSNYVGYPSVTAGTGTFTGTAGGSAQDVNVNGPSYAASGGHDFLTNTYAGDSFTGVYELTISLSSYVTAFGLDFGTSASGQDVSFGLSNGATASTTTTQSFFDGLEFIGFTSSTPFDTITLSVTGPNGWGVEDITTAVAATPLPAALPLFAGGLGMVGLLARRRKRKSLGAFPAA